MAIRPKITGNKTDFISIKTSTKTLRLVRLISGYTGEKHYEITERLLEIEFEKVRKEFEAKEKAITE